MPNKTHKRTKSKKKADADRRGRAARQLLLESLESRVVLTGTPTLIDLNPAGASNPTDFTPVGDVTYFVADDGTNGRELWVTDGTLQGTSLVHDIRSGSDSSNPQQLVEFGGELLFVADDGVNGEELWKTDGTQAGTVLVRDINPGTPQSSPRGPVEVNGQVFLGATDATNGAELWATDGTTAGTVLVRDIVTGTYTNNNGTYPNSSNVQNLTNVDGTLFFTADDGTNGRELWTSDGTADGTVMVQDVFTGSFPYDNGTNVVQIPNSSNPQKLTAAGGLLFFVANDADGQELWRSDGTDSGTFKLQDINPGSADAFVDSSELTALGNLLLFTANDGTTGDELWRSDGTTAGTVQLVDINPGSGGNLSNYTGFTEVNGTLFFSANDGFVGRELWRTDGTAAGTMLVKDVNPGTDGSGAPANSYPFYMTSANGLLYFSALSGGAGRELWQSDGTAAGTRLVADAVDGPAGLNPAGLERVGDTILFTGDDGTGRELWVLEPEAEATNNTARLTIFASGQQVAIPANVGVNGDGSTAALFTNSDTGEVLSDLGSSVTLGDFFDIWRTNAGLAGNNADAVLSANQLLDNVADSTNTVQMFVNGQVSDAFGAHVLQDGDEVILVYGDDPVVALNTNFGSLVVELFETETPGTVNNFLNYVNDGDYINSFFHRSATFSGAVIIQGGGFATTSTDFSSTLQFSSVPADPPIQNEPFFSNVRGTIAMAKTSDPDSATNQFFVNLAAANTLLDDPNNSGGFTVFGQVLDLTTSDAIADLPINTNSPAPFGELPLGPSNELVVVQSIEGQGEITGIKFSDDNLNGVHDAGEAGVPGIAVFIDDNDNGVLDPGEIATTTDAAGGYLLQVEPGTYTVRAEVSPGHGTTVPTAPDSYSVTVEIGREVSDRDFGESDLFAPSGVNLLDRSDTGNADDDELTNLNNAAGATLQFEVAGVTAGAEVRILSDGVQIGTATATGDTVTVTTDGMTTLTDGVHNITAIQVSGGGQTDASPTLAITVDTVPPAAIASTAPATAQSGMAYTFDADSPDEGQTGVGYLLVNAPLGMTIDAATGAVSWTPAADQAVPQSFEIRVSDGAGNSTAQAVDLTVLGVIPALPEEYTVVEDNVLTVDAASGVLQNDGDNNSATLTATVVDQPANGSLVLAMDGSFSYTPDADFFGEDSFTYRATDGTDDSNVARVSINVSAANDAPVPTSDSYTVPEDNVLNVDAAAGVLANDADIENDPLTATIASQAANGTVALAADGSFTYTPDTDFSGSDSFTYTVGDGTVTSDPVTVSLTVTGVADPPVPVADSFSATEDTALTVSAASGVLANDSDPDTANLVASLQTQAANGSVSLNNDGSFTYTPNANFFGSDSFTYTASDGTTESGATTVSITVAGQPDAPEAVDDSATATSDGGEIIIDVRSNDTSDPDGVQTLTITDVSQGSEGGTVAISNGSVSYTAAAGFSGTETFTYTIQDSDGLTDTATVTLTVTEAANNSLSGFVYFDFNRDGVRDPGDSGVPGVQITLSGTDLAGNAVNRTTLTTNSGSYSFEDLPGGNYQLSERQPTALVDGSDSMNIPGATSGNDVISSISLTGGQSFTQNNFGEAELLPEYNSVVFRFASTVREVALRNIIAFAEAAEGDTALADAIREGGTEVPEDTNADPVAIDDSYSVDENSVLTVAAATGVLANDSDSDGDPLTATVVTQPANGTVTLSADGSLTYAPGSDFVGTDSFTYRASDGSAFSSTATVTITVNEVTPAANTFTLDENSPAGTVVGTLVPEGELGNSVVFEVEDPALNEALQLAPDDHITGNPAGSVVLIEYLDFQCPVCQAFHPIVEQLEMDFADDLLVVSRHLPLENIHFNARAAAIAAEAANRQNAFDAFGDLLFERQDDWEFSNNPQSFFETYATELGLDLTQFRADQADTALQTRVQRDIDAAGVLGATGTPTFFLNGQQIANPSSAEAFASLVQAEVDAVDDVFSVNRQTGEIIVRDSSALDFETAGSFSLAVNARGLNGASSMITATVNLNDVNESTPVAVSDSFTVEENGVLTGDVLANDTDADSSVLTAQLATDTSNGTLTLNTDGSFSYAPNAGFSGSDQFSYTASDGTFTSSVATVSITVTDVPDPTTAVSDSYSEDEDTTLIVSVANGVLANDSSSDGSTLTATLSSQASNGTVSLNSDGSFSYVPDADFNGTDSFTYTASDNTGSAAATVTITVNAIDETTVLQPSQDTSLFESATGALANGSGSFLFSGLTEQASDAIRRGLVEFDVAAAIPAGATISNVTLTMNMSRTNNGDFDVSLHPVQSDWGEGASDADGEEGMGTTPATDDATWLHSFFDTQTWANPGGDFDATASATTSVGGVGSYEWSSAELVADVQGWLDDPATNFGWAILTDESAPSAKRFDSSEHPTIANRPQLLVEYELSGVGGEPNLGGVRLETASTDGTPISSITQGGDFVLNVYARDLRDTPEGVFAGYLDVLYDSPLVSLNGDPIFDAQYGSGQRFDTTSLGVVDELGAFRSTTTPTGLAEALLLSIPFTADAVGTAQFSSDAADVRPDHDFLLFGLNNAIPSHLISFDTALLEIVAQASAEGEGEPAGLRDFTSAADELFAAEDDWLN